MGAVHTQIAYGKVTGTGANIDVNIGFKPRWVEIMNQTKISRFVWTADMANGYAFKRVTAGTMSVVTSLGITPLDDGTTLGFRIGTEGQLNAASDVIHYIAYL